VREEGWKEKDPKVMPTAEQVNKLQDHSFENSHDAINRGILIRTRCKRFGIPVYCPDCDGNFYVYTAPKAHMNLVLWLIHPRKGASRGVEVKHVEQEDLPAVFKFLKEAACRNAKRFAKVVRQK
jgi:hypothetical protein